MKSVATRDVIAGDLAGLAILAIANHGSIGLEFEQIDVERFVHGGRADRGPRVHQIARHLGLAIDGDGPARQRLEVDAMPRAFEGDLDPVVNEALSVQAAAAPASSIRATALSSTPARIRPRT